jgi:hypothetical protein
MNNGKATIRFHYVMLATAGLVATFAMSGCGDDGDGDGDGTGGGGGVAALNRYVREVAQIQCDQLARCCPVDTLDLPPGVSCQDAFVQFFSDFGADVEEQIRLGTVVVDQQAAEACLAEARAEETGCQVTTSPEPSGGSACDIVLRGTAAEGGSCTITDECVTGFCAYADEQATTGVCTTSVEGGPCALDCGVDIFSDGERTCDQDCSEGFSCNTFAEAPTCQAFSSSSPGLGEACTGFCDTGLRCSTEGVCAEDLPAGTPCADDFDCDSTECSDEGLCVDVSICDNF